LRNRLRKVLLENKAEKYYHTKELIGCSWEEFKRHIESKFSKGMNWDNYGEWHMDHIKPCAAFDLTQKAEQKKCFHYSNFQPMWASDNCSKNSRYRGKRIFREQRNETNS
jgi:hypothetical protein